MKNKAQISFWVNLLIGLIFSFPVLTASSGVSNYLAAGEDPVQVMNIIDVNQNVPAFVKLINAEEPVKISTSKTEKRIKLSGNNNTTKFISERLVRNDFEYPFFYSDRIPFDPVFVDLSFLKELRTIKMLC